VCSTSSKVKRDQTANSASQIQGFYANDERVLLLKSVSQEPLRASRKLTSSHSELSRTQVVVNEASTETQFPWLLTEV